MFCLKSTRTRARALIIFLLYHFGIFKSTNNRLQNKRQTTKTGTNRNVKSNRQPYKRHFAVRRRTTIHYVDNLQIASKNRQKKHKQPTAKRTDVTQKKQNLTKIARQKTLYTDKLVAKPSTGLAQTKRRQPVGRNKRPLGKHTTKKLKKVFMFCRVGGIIQARYKNKTALKAHFCNENIDYLCKLSL